MVHENMCRVRVYEVKHGRLANVLHVQEHTFATPSSATLKAAGETLLLMGWIVSYKMGEDDELQRLEAIHRAVPATLTVNAAGNVEASNTFARSEWALHAARWFRESTPHSTK